MAVVAVVAAVAVVVVVVTVVAVAVVVVVVVAVVAVVDYFNVSETSGSLALRTRPAQRRQFRRLEKLLSNVELRIA